MKYVKFPVWVLVVLVLGLLSAGCAKPPEGEKGAAAKAMDAAISAGADKYATADSEAAKKIWNTAESQMNKKKYKEAKQSYIDAKAAFEKAIAAVEAGKKAMADQTKAALQALEEKWKQLESRAKKMGKKVKEKKDAWTNDAKTITEGLGMVREMVATNPAEAKLKLDELKAMVDQWENTFKKMITPSVKPKAAKKRTK